MSSGQLPRTQTAPAKAATMDRGQLAMSMLKQAIEKRKNEIAKLIGSALTPDRLIRICLSDVAKTPQLLACRPESIAYCLIVAAQFGLQLGGPLAEVYMVPRKNKNRGGQLEAHPMIGYRGYCTLARRSKDIASLDAGVVYKGDRFAFDRATGRVEHPYSFDVDRSDKEVIGAYAIARVKGSDYPITVVLSRAEIEKRRARSSAVQSGKSTPWDTDYAAMCRKTGLRALLTSGLVPLTVEMMDAMEHEREEDEERIVPIEFTEPTEVGAEQEEPQNQEPSSEPVSPSPALATAVAPEPEHTGASSSGELGPVALDPQGPPAEPAAEVAPAADPDALPADSRGLRDAIQAEWKRLRLSGSDGMAILRDDLGMRVQSLGPLDDDKLIRALRHLRGLGTGKQ